MIILLFAMFYVLAIFVGDELFVEMVNGNREISFRRILFAVAWPAFAVMVIFCHVIDRLTDAARSWVSLIDRHTRSVRNH